MKRLLLIPAFLTVISIVYCQTQSLTVKQKNADGVFLINHQSVPNSSVSIIDESSGKEINIPLIVNGKLNNNSVQEKVHLNTARIIKLAEMLNYRKGRKIERGMCYDPHHAVIIIKAGHLSYIDVCFGCGLFRTSKDIRLPDIEKKTGRNCLPFLKEKELNIKCLEDSLNSLPFL